MMTPSTFKKQCFCSNILVVVVDCVDRSVVCCAMFAMRWNIHLLQVSGTLGDNYISKYAC